MKYLVSMLFILMLLIGCRSLDDSVTKSKIKNDSPKHLPALTKKLPKTLLKSPSLPKIIWHENKDTSYPYVMINKEHFYSILDYIAKLRQYSGHLESRAPKPDKNDILVEPDAIFPRPKKLSPPM